MIGLIQRVSRASIEVNHKTITNINLGITALIGIEKTDSRSQADRLLERILGYRIFPDGDGKMNLSLVDINGDLLLVPQFTLAAETKKGMRPGFSLAATAEVSKELFDYFLQQAHQKYEKVYAGIFAADMQVTLTNDGPVTFWLQV